jgi:peroxiredoxin
MPLRYGQPAPDVSLPSSLGRDVTLAEFKGKSDIVLAFFCYAWGGI